MKKEGEEGGGRERAGPTPGGTGPSEHTSRRDVLSPTTGPTGGGPHVGCGGTSRVRGTERGSVPFALNFAVGESPQFTLSNHSRLLSFLFFGIANKQEKNSNVN